MTSSSNTATTAHAHTVLRALPAFQRVWLDSNGVQQTCSLKTAVFELKRQHKTLADITLVDLDGHSAEQRSRQCQIIFDALLESGLPDPTFTASKALFLAQGLPSEGR